MVRVSVRYVKQDESLELIAGASGVDTNDLPEFRWTFQGKVIQETRDENFRAKIEVTSVAKSQHHGKYQMYQQVRPIGEDTWILRRTWMVVVSPIYESKFMKPGYRAELFVPAQMPKRTHSKTFRWLLLRVPTERSNERTLVALNMYVLGWRATVEQQNLAARGLVTDPGNPSKVSGIPARPLHYLSRVATERSGISRAMQILSVSYRVQERIVRQVVDSVKDEDNFQTWDEVREAILDYDEYWSLYAYFQNLYGLADEKALEFLGVGQNVNAYLVEETAQRDTGLYVCQQRLRGSRHWVVRGAFQLSVLEPEERVTRLVNYSNTITLRAQPTVWQRMHGVVSWGNPDDPGQGIFIQARETLDVQGSRGPGEFSRVAMLEFHRFGEEDNNDGDPPVPWHNESEDDLIQWDDLIVLSGPQTVLRAFHVEVSSLVETLDVRRGQTIRLDARPFIPVDRLLDTGVFRWVRRRKDRVQEELQQISPIIDVARVMDADAGRYVLFVDGYTVEFVVHVRSRDLRSQNDYDPEQNSHSVAQWHAHRPPAQNRAPVLLALDPNVPLREQIRAEPGRLGAVAGRMLELRNLFVARGFHSQDRRFEDPTVPGRFSMDRYIAYATPEDLRVASVWQLSTLTDEEHAFHARLFDRDNVRAKHYNHLKMQGYRSPMVYYDLDPQIDRWACCRQRADHPGCWVGSHSADSDQPDLHDIFAGQRGSKWLFDESTSLHQHQEIVAAHTRGDVRRVLQLEAEFNALMGGSLNVAVAEADEMIRAAEAVMFRGRIRIGDTSNGSAGIDNDDDGTLSIVDLKRGLMSKVQYWVFDPVLYRQWYPGYKPVLRDQDLDRMVRMIQRHEHERKLLRGRPDMTLAEVAELGRHRFSPEDRLAVAEFLRRNGVDALFAARREQIDRWYARTDNHEGRIGAQRGLYKRRLRELDAAQWFDNPTTRTFREDLEQRWDDVTRRVAVERTHITGYEKRVDHDEQAWKDMLDQVSEYNTSNFQTRLAITQDVLNDLDDLDTEKFNEDFIRLMSQLEKLPARMLELRRARIAMADTLPGIIAEERATLVTHRALVQAQLRDVSTLEEALEVLPVDYLNPVNSCKSTRRSLVYPVNSTRTLLL